MPNVSKESASNKISLEGLEVRREDLDSGYTVCFEEHTVDADLAPLCKGLPNDKVQVERWGYVIKGKIGFRMDGREEIHKAGDAYYVPAGHTPVHYAGAEIVEFSPTDGLDETVSVIMKNFEAMETAGSPR